MKVYFLYKKDSLNNILIHDIIKSLSQNQPKKIILPLLAWNFISSNTLGIRETVKFWILINSYISGTLEREGLENYFRAKFKIENCLYLLGLQKIAIGIGFFQVGAELNLFHCTKLIEEYAFQQNNYTFGNAIKGYVSLGYLTAASNLLNSRNLNFQLNKKNKFLINEAKIYISLCLNSDLKASHSFSRFDEYVKDKDIFLIGPADYKLEHDFVKVKNALVSRRIGVGADKFNDQYQEKFGLKIVYTDSFYLDMKEDLEKWIFEEQIEFLSITQSIESNNESIRTARNFNALFSSGSANKMQVALYDLLLSEPNNVFCDGITFWASEVAYRNDSLDLNQKGQKINSNGATGTKFFVSLALAEHNIFVNRIMFKNLGMSNRVVLSRSVESVLSLSDLEFAKILDKLYGERKL